MEKTIDIICIGELLIDYIGKQEDTLQNTTEFEAFVGGSPTNVAINMSKLGLKSALVASCGIDDFGKFALNKLNNDGVNTLFIEKLQSQTSVIYISRSKTTPEFKAVREADFYILEHQIPDELLEKSKIFHTTCFALSKNPAQTTILNRAKKASEMGLQLSIDINYSDKIWADRTEMQQVIEEYLSYNPLVKVSDDDCFRIFNESKTDDDIFKYFHSLGANTVCLTKGKNGVKLSDKISGILFAEPIKIDKIIDTTGAGDAFWSGFLFSKLQNKSWLECLSFAQKIAVIKLQNIGGLPDNIDL